MSLTLYANHWTLFVLFVIIDMLLEELTQLLHSVVDFRFWILINHLFNPGKVLNIASLFVLSADTVLHGSDEIADMLAPLV